MERHTSRLGPFLLSSSPEVSSNRKTAWEALPLHLLIPDIRSFRLSGRSNVPAFGHFGRFGLSTVPLLRVCMRTNRHAFTFVLEFGLMERKRKFDSLRTVVHLWTVNLLCSLSF